MSLLLLGCSSEFSTRIATDGGSSGVIVDGKPVMGSVAQVNGDYTWTVLAPPRLDRETQAIAVVSPNDIWFVGNGIRRWNGTALSDVVAPQPVTMVTAIAGPDVAHHSFLNQAAVVSPTDIWVAGSTVQHWDGTQWSNLTSMFDTNAYPIFAYGVLTNGSDVVVYSEQTLKRRSANWAVETPSVTPSSSCLHLMGDGQVMAFGDQGFQPTTTTQRGFSGACGPFVWSGSTVYLPGYIQAGEAIFGVGRGTVPGNNVAPIGDVPRADYAKRGFIGSSAVARAGAATAMGVVFTIEAMDRSNRLATLLVEYDGTAVRLLPDTLWGWEVRAIASVDGALYVVGQGGAILKGVKR